MNHDQNGQCPTFWTGAESGPAQAESCLARIIAIIAGMGGEIATIKVSRVDLCADLLLEYDQFSLGLLNQIVTRARKKRPHLEGERFTGLQFGQGTIVLRLYDKPLEIQQQSRKFWMYDIWGIEEVPDGCRVVRVEYQLRREALKQFQINSLNDLLELMPNLWAELTTGWSRGVDDVTLHHTQQKVLDWWQVVIDAVPDARTAHPLVRAKAIQTELKQLYSQIQGLCVSVTALLRQGDLIHMGESLDLHSHLMMVLKTGRDHYWTDREFTERVKRRQALTNRNQAKFEIASSALDKVKLSLASSKPKGKPS